MKSDGLVAKIIAGVAIALLAGGTSPWWYNVLFPKPVVHELSTQEKNEVHNLANILQTLAEKSISRASIAMAIRNYATSHTDFNREEIDRYLKQIDKENTRLNKVMNESALTNFIITRNDLYKEIAAIRNDKIALAQKLHFLFPSLAESQTMELLEVAKGFETLQPRLESVSDELQSYLQQQNPTASSPQH